ncbi:hypothetical protein ACP4OV_015976 [Aristida adscensionis]
MSYLPKTLQKPASPEEQQRKINEVREVLGDLPAAMPKFLTDGTIRRFLRGRGWSTAQAAKSLRDAVKWRRQYMPHKIRWEDIAERENEIKRSYIPDYLDKNGRTVFLIQPSLKSLASAKERVKMLVYNLENMALSSEEAQEENVVWVVDFRGWKLSNTPLAESRESLHIIQNYYPGLVAAAIFTNPPKVFESFWKIISYFIEPKMKERVKFVYTDNSESLKSMADMFDLDKLESAFGGRSTAALDVVKYAERMRTRDRIRGA